MGFTAMHYTPQLLSEPEGKTIVMRNDEVYMQ